MLVNFIIFAASLFLVIKGATMTIKYAEKLAVNFKLSQYFIGFVIVAVFSVLPEAFISINSAIKGTPSFGLGTLIGSNVADLTLIVALIIFFAGRDIKVESKILKNNAAYPFLLLLPIILGLDGFYSRLEGLSLIVAGAVFYFAAFRKGTDNLSFSIKNEKRHYKLFAILIFGIALLLLGSYFTVVSAENLAESLGISPILIGILIVGLGTTTPELFFSLKSVKKRDDELAIGDILGTVLANATIIVGILSLISPFEFPRKIIYVTGLFMVVAAFILFYFMRSGKTLSKKEGYLLLVFWIFFILVEFLLNK